jgi:hypothetical protein
MVKFHVASLLAVLAVATAKEDPSLRGTARDLHDWQLGDFASARPQSIPGNYYSGGASTSSNTATTTTTTSSGLAVYAKVGDKGVPASAYPFSACQGDCDTDADCQQGLVCSHRTGTESLPGCSGTAPQGMDYCYDPNAASASTTTTTVAAPTGSTGGFRLRLFWQQGDFWHHQYGELFLCMVCHTVALGGSSCLQGDDTHFMDCSDTSTHYNFNSGPNGGNQIQVAGSDLCLELSSTASYAAVTLQICDSGNANQYFTAGQGDFGTTTFELSANGGGCLSSTHLPKEGEYIYNQDCSQPRSVNANLWQKW